jgi:hypothetical protein
MQQWREFPQEMTGRRKNAKKSDFADVAVPISPLVAASSAVVDDITSVESDLFCEACRKWFKSEQQMQQHVASKKHKEKELEWNDLLAASRADAVVDEEEDKSVFAAASADDSDEEFEAQLQRMHMGGGGQQQGAGAAFADGEGLCVEDIVSRCASAGDGSDSGLDDEEEASLNVGKKKKKKKVKKGLMADTTLSQEMVADAAVLSAPGDDGDDDKGEEETAPGKKLTKKQIRRYQFGPA